MVEWEISVRSQGLEDLILWRSRIEDGGWMGIDGGRSCRVRVNPLTTRKPPPPLLANKINRRRVGKAGETSSRSALPLSINLIGCYGGMLEVSLTDFPYSPVPVPHASAASPPILRQSAKSPPPPWDTPPPPPPPTPPTTPFPLLSPYLPHSIFLRCSRRCRDLRLIFPGSR